MSAPRDLDHPTSRISPEALDRLHELSSPTRVSIYDRNWFIWGLVAVAVFAILGYLVYLARR